MFLLFALFLVTVYILNFFSEVCNELMRPRSDSLWNILQLLRRSEMFVDMSGKQKEPIV